MGCKGIRSILSAICQHDLIETYWDVKLASAASKATFIGDLIETYWDINCKILRTKGKICMEERITGIMIYYYFVCRRKLWYFCHEINMESGNEDVQLGKLLDETSYGRSEKHIQINGEINIDFIKEHRELHEIKKSKSIEQAGIWQVKYYLYYLKKRGVDGLKAKIDYPLLKENVTVELSKDDEIQLQFVIKDIVKMKKEKSPPIMKKTKLCSKCAYRDLCLI